MDDLTNQGDTSPSSLLLTNDAISELFQNPVQMDIAATLGLFDDPTSLQGCGLDTTNMIDPSSLLNPISSMAGQPIFNDPIQSSSDSGDLLQQAMASVDSKGDERMIQILPISTTSSDISMMQDTTAASMMESTLNPADLLVSASTASELASRHSFRSSEKVNSDQPQILSKNSSTLTNSGHVFEKLNQPHESMDFQTSDTTSTTMQASQADIQVSEASKSTAAESIPSSVHEDSKLNQLQNMESTAVSETVQEPSACKFPPSNTESKDDTTLPAASTATCTESDTPTTTSTATAIVPTVSTLPTSESTLHPTTAVQPNTSALSSVASPSTLSFPTPTQPSAAAAAVTPPAVSTPMTQPKPLPVSQPVPVPLSQPAQPVVSQPVSVAVSQPVSVAVSQPVSVTVSQPVSVTVSQPVSVPVSQPVSVTVSQPVSVTVSQPVSVPVSQAVPVPVFQPVSVTVSQPVSVPLSQPVSVPVSQPVSVAVSQSTPTAVSPSAESQPSSSSQDTTPKGLNLPLLEFLRANFPSLRLDSPKDIFQVNTLLAHVLQQQQVLQQAQLQVSQAQQAAALRMSSVNQASKLIASSASLLSNQLSPVQVASPVSQQTKPVMSPATTTTPTIFTQGTLAKNRTPVFAQILPQTSSTGTISLSTSTTTTKTAPSPIVVPKQQNRGFTSPILLGKQKVTTDKVIHTTLASIPSVFPNTPSPLHTSMLMTKPTSSRKEPIRPSVRTPAKHTTQNVSQGRTLIKPSENEFAEIDVGEPFQILDLPPHLKDHCYSRYNPEEGEKVSKLKGLNLKINSSIPPARVSYAPQVPDSPTTLYKLLKVAPRKSSSRSGGGSSRTTRRTNSRSKGRFTPSGGGNGRSRRARGVGLSTGRSSLSSSRAGSEASMSSASDLSDGESDTSKSERRRSQRTAGQRKRYVDDLNIAFSDEEMQEEVMNPRTKTKKDYRGYGDDEDSEYDHSSNSAMSKSAKHKTKTISINPTEGFQYSDLYFEPPPEEANVVERILSSRIRDSKTEEEEKKYGNEMEEFLVKYKNYSYLHAEWASYDKILTGDKRFDGKVKRYKAKQALMGVFANVDDEPFNPEYTVVDRAIDMATQAEPNGEVLTHYLVKWRSLPYEDATWELEEDVDMESIRKYNKLQMVPMDDEIQFVPRPPPAAFRSIKESKPYNDDNRLRPYQMEGVNWLLFNWYTRQNCILADEMGLGKTVQSIALLIEIFNAGIRGPFLVIAPLSTITNWQREFEAWSDFNIIVYHGSATSRKLIHEYELYYRNSGGQIIPDTFKFNAIITTYEVILSDDSELQHIQWRVVVIDEAHRLKNRNCKLLEGLKTLHMEHRVLLTGTPLQNSVEELFSLLNFLEPNKFPSHIAFLQQFGDLKTEEQVEELKLILKPMMLRRLKEDVEKSLAPKEETIVEVELTVIQKQYYRAILERNFTFLSKGAVPSLLNVMMELRKCCNHPFLIQGAELQIVADFQRQHSDQPLSNVLIQASGKLVLINKLLPKLKENGHKVLIFSQMVRCLDILEDYLRMMGYLYERIDGNVRGILRQEAIDRFSKPNSDRFVFLLCTRAGGLGINLTAADTVIIYDSDWNPQNDIQAQARCHRIGQNKAVKVYRIITRNTYEREMFERASLKLGLDKAVLQSMHGQHQQTQTSGSGPPQLSKKEIEDLLRKGAYGAIMEEDDDANKFCEEDIDQILERRARVIQLESEGKGSTFAKASFVADGSSDISVDDPDFWQKWAEKAQLDLDELANKDSLVLDTPRQRRQVRRYGNDNVEEIVDMAEALDEVVDILPSKGKKGWTKLECLKVEKGLLTYGWGQWKKILRNGKFKKRQLGMRDVENIARTMIVYCLVHFTGDDKVPPYVTQLIDPTVISAGTEDRDPFYENFTEEDYINLRTKDTETLFQDISYMKHLRRHANKILLRIRQLHILRWSMMAPYMDKIVKGVTAKSLGLNLPRPEEPPPTSWWSVDCDYSLLVGIVKHGYEQFGLMRSDPALCFKALCGEEPPRSKKKNKGTSHLKNTSSVRGDDSEVSESGEESDGESGPSTPATPSNKRLTRSSLNTIPLKPGQYPWPSLADVNTRARRYVSTWVKHQKREEVKQAHLVKEREKREREAEVSRKRELKKAELAQKWSKREEQDFVRVISFYGVEFNRKANKYEWTRFRQLANLSKKSDERLTLYLHDFKQMCWRVLKKKLIKKGLSGVRVEPVTEERATRCLQRLNLLTVVREEILPHREFDELIQLCELSFEVPQWWIPGEHDRDLLKGVAIHGLYRTDQVIYNDPELCFKETVPQTALFDPSGNHPVHDESGSAGSEEEGEEGEGSKGRTNSSNPVPLGWPKEKAILIRISRIAYSFRNGVWPKPMEGLDLFAPSLTENTHSDSSDSEESSMLGEEPFLVDVEGDKDFEIEKSHGLKLTLKKSIPKTKIIMKHQQPTTEEDPTKLEIKIPLVQLSFASSSGLKKIPKKRPASERGDSPDAKRQKTSAASASAKVVTKIVDPKTISFTDLNGQERVGVINRNTREMLPLKQSPTLKGLRSWLEGHPHFNVDKDWGPLVIEWGALKPEMYQRILPLSATDSDQDDSIMSCSPVSQ